MNHPVQELLPVNLLGTKWNPRSARSGKSSNVCSLIFISRSRACTIVLYRPIPESEESNGYEPESSVSVAGGKGHGTRYNSFYGRCYNLCYSVVHQV